MSNRPRKRGSTFEISIDGAKTRRSLVLEPLGQVFGSKNTTLSSERLSEHALVLCRTFAVIPFTFALQATEENSISQILAG